MYTVSKGPSKIVAKTRRGISQNLERLGTLKETKRSPNSKEEDDYIVNVQKPVFHTVNGHKKVNQRFQPEVISPQHEEIIKFVYESWNMVCKECEHNNVENDRRSHSAVYYDDGVPNSQLQDSIAIQCRSFRSIFWYKNHKMAKNEVDVLLEDFKPFDLESWWGKRLFHNITKSVP